MVSLFTKIIDREIPADIVYEDDLVIAFLDINPVNHGHTLVVPKEEHPDFSSIPESLLKPYFERIQRVADAVVEGMDADGYNLMFNSGAAAGQVVFHVHAHVIPRFEGDGYEHVIPRFEGDGYEHWHGPGYESDTDKKRCAEKIRSKFDA